MKSGLAALPDGTLLDAQGNPSDRLSSIGPPLKGILWESIAAPEIRHQALQLAALLLSGTG